MFITFELLHDNSIVAEFSHAFIPEIGDNIFLTASDLYQVHSRIMDYHENHLTVKLIKL